jgi:hypothetical protein
MARDARINGGAKKISQHHSVLQLEVSMTTLDSHRNFSQKCLAWLLLVAIVVAVYVVWSNDFVIHQSTTSTRTPHRYIQTHDKFTTKHHKNRLPTKNATACNCFHQEETCCQRTVYRFHKMGTILVGDLFQHFRHDSRHRIRTKHVPWNVTAFTTNMDYRHVFITRNWWNAIVSGYLYHKAGYECWMDYRGKVREENRTNDWDAHLEFHTQNDILYPPRNNRSLCAYLQQESEEDGMKVIIDIALSWWYKGAIPYYRQAQEQLKQTHEHKSLFLCFEHLANPFQQEAIFHDMLQHFFPGQNTSYMNMPLVMKNMLLEQQLNHSIYQGEHASTHNVKLRTRLRKLVVRLDRELFDNAVATSNAIFNNCG